VPPHDPDLIGMSPPARGWPEKIGRVFISRGMFRHLGLGQRALLVANILLLIPSLLTLSGEALSAQFETRITQLDQLRVALTAEEREAVFQQALKTPAPPPAPESKVDDQSFVHIANAHAVAFEGSVARGLEQRLHLSTIDPSAPRADTALRRDNARKQILEAVAAHPQPS